MLRHRREIESGMNLAAAAGENNEKGQKLIIKKGLRSPRTGLGFAQFRHLVDFKGMVDPQVNFVSVMI
jgi:hypothetical protein